MGGERLGAANLVVVGPTPPPFHGVAVMTEHVLEAFAEAGVVTVHLDTADRRHLNSIARFDFENARLAVSHAWKLLGLLRVNRKAAVYLPLSQSKWGFIRDAVLVWIAVLSRRAVYAHFHGSSFQRFYSSSSPLMRLMIRRVMSSLAEVWVLTSSLRGVFEGLVPAERIRVIENVIADPWPTGFHRQDSKAGAMRVVFLGNLQPGKGVDALLDALLMVGEGASGWTVRIVGQARLGVEDMLRERLNELSSLGVDVRLTGSLYGAEKNAELQAADVFAYPTRDDGQPLVLLEAMSAGLAIVTTRVGGIPDTVGEGTEALFTDASRPDELAASLVTLSNEVGLRAELGLAARSRFERNYRPARLAADVAAFAKERIF